VLSCGRIEVAGVTLPGSVEREGEGIMRRDECGGSQEGLGMYGFQRGLLAADLTVQMSYLLSLQLLVLLEYLVVDFAWNGEAEAFGECGAG
jgi:hypothetical protein